MTPCVLESHYRFRISSSAGIVPRWTSVTWPWTPSAASTLCLVTSFHLEAQVSEEFPNMPRCPKVRVETEAQMLPILEQDSRSSTDLKTPIEVYSGGEDLGKKRANQHNQSHGPALRMRNQFQKADSVPAHYGSHF